MIALYKHIILMLCIFAMTQMTAHSFTPPPTDTTAEQSRTNESQHDSTAEKPDCLKLAIAGTMSAAAMTAGHFVSYTYYWHNNGSFHLMSLKNEYDDALLSDKFGHLFFTYAVTQSVTYLWEWTGFDRQTSTIIAASLAMAAQTYVELQDGFSHGAPYLGFSFGDFAANAAGAGLALLHEYYPFARNFKLKMNIIKSPNYLRYRWNLLEDYESKYNWLSVNINTFLPDAWKPYCPDFLSIALGFSVKDLDRRGRGYHEVFLALDWDLEKIIGDDFISRFLKNSLNLYKMPSPAVKIYPDVVWYGLMF